MGFCSCIGKTGLTLINIILLAISAVCLAIGIYGFVQGLYKESNLALGTYAALVALGALIFITAVIGFVGICQNKTAALTCYLAFIVAVLIISAALAGFFTYIYVSYKNDPNGVLRSAWNSSPADVIATFQKNQNCNGFDTSAVQGVPPCGPIIVDMYNRFAMISLIVIWAVFGVLLLTTIITCLVRNDIYDDMRAAAAGPAAYKV